MRIYSDLQRGLLAALALAGLQVVSPANAQYSPYPQNSTAYPQATQQSYAQPAQQTFAQAAAQPHAPTAAMPAQQSYAQPTAPVAQPAYSQSAFAQPSSPQQSFAVAQRPMAQPAAAQQPYNPQQPPQQYTPATVYSQYAPAQSYNPARPGVAAPSYLAAAPHAATPQSYPQQQQSQSYLAPYSPPRVAMAYQPQGTSVDNLPLNAPAEDITPAPGQNGTYFPQPAPGADYAPAQGYPAPGATAPNGASAGADCNCQSNGYESYPGYGYGNGGAYGACNTNSACGYDQPGAMARVLGKHGAGYWFGGAYGLYMERDSSDKVPLTFATAPMPPGDYPPSDAVVLTTRNVDLEYMPGVEFRLGRTFGGGYDPCGGSCGCGPTWGVEAVYWTLFEDDAYAQYADNGIIRVYSMLDPRGLEYNNGGGYRPVREYWDYAPPSEDHTAGGDIEVRLARVRSSFEMHNLELNLLRLGVCGDMCAGPAMCSVGGCDSGACGTDACAGGYAPAMGYRGSRFSCTGVCGVRWMQFDEDFMYGVDFDGPSDGYLDYWSTVENNLVGFQLGCNGMYRIGCKWGVHMNTNVGVYGNDIDTRQYMNSPTGLVRFIETGENFDVTASKTDVAMMGEMRLGASYQATCRCRVYGGWRAMGISGIALATDQAPGAFISAAQLGNYVNSNGSLILHGLQTGVEWNY
jgi:hypothetical protein